MLAITLFLQMAIQQPLSMVEHAALMKVFQASGEKSCLFFFFFFFFIASLSQPQDALKQIVQRFLKIHLVRTCLPSNAQMAR